MTDSDHDHDALNSVLIGAGVGLFVGGVIARERHPGLWFAALATCPFTAAVPVFLLGWLLGPLTLVLAIPGVALPFWLLRRAERWENDEALWEAVQAERRYRDRYEALVAEVASPQELKTVRSMWDVAEPSFVQQRFLDGAFNRWWADNPPRWPSRAGTAVGLAVPLRPHRARLPAAGGRQP